MLHRTERLRRCLLPGAEHRRRSGALGAASVGEEEGRSTGEQREPGDLVLLKKKRFFLLESVFLFFFNNCNKTCFLFFFNNCNKTFYIYMFF